MSYNIKDSSLRLAREFLRRGVQFAGFSSSDGGGFCGYIFEFQKKEDLENYCWEQVRTSTPRCWIEHSDGRHEDISNEMSAFGFQVVSPIVPGCGISYKTMNEPGSQYEGIKSAIIDLAKADRPACPHCGSGPTQHVLPLCGTTLRIAGVMQVKLVTEKPDGKYFCDQCYKFFDKADASLISGNGESEEVSADPKKETYAQRLLEAEEALELAEKDFGPDHPEVAKSLNALASLHQGQGQFAQGELFSRRSIAIMEKELGPEHSHLAAILNNFATVYYYTDDHCQKAEPLYIRSLAILEKNFDPTHSLIGACLRNLSALYAKLGRWEEIEPLEKRIKLVPMDIGGI
jgi:tetratricopeptide (TPR) repeat protein